MKTANWYAYAVDCTDDKDYTNFGELINWLVGELVSWLIGELQTAN